MAENSIWTLRPHKAGESMAKSIIEIVHLMYQNTTAIRFLVALIYELDEELRRRENGRPK